MDALASYLVGETLSAEPVSVSLAHALDDLHCRPVYVSVALLNPSGRKLVAVADLAMPVGSDKKVQVHKASGSLAGRALKAGPGVLVQRERLGNVMEADVQATVARSDVAGLLCSAIPNHLQPQEEAGGKLDREAGALGTLTLGFPSHAVLSPKVKGMVLELAECMGSILPPHVNGFLDEVSSFLLPMCGCRGNPGPPQGLPYTPCRAPGGKDGPGRKDRDIDGPSSCRSAAGDMITTSLKPAPSMTGPHTHVDNITAAKRATLTAAAQTTTGTTTPSSSSSSSSHCAGHGRLMSQIAIQKEGHAKAKPVEAMCSGSGAWGKAPTVQQQQSRATAFAINRITGRFVDPEIERDFRLELAKTHRTRDLTAVALICCASVIVNLSESTHLSLFSTSRIWMAAPLLNCAWLLLNRTWYLANRDAALSIWAALIRAHQVRRALMIRWYMPDQLVVLGGHWLFVVPMVVAIDSLFLLRNVWVRALLLCCSLMGAAAAFPHGYGWLSPVSASLVSAGNIFAAEAIFMWWSRRLDCQQRAHFAARSLVSN